MTFASFHAATVEKAARQALADTQPNTLDWENRQRLEQIAALAATSSRLNGEDARVTLDVSDHAMLKGNL